MSRRVSASTPHKSKTNTRRNTCRALVLLDSGPILKALRRQYAQARRQIEKAERDLRNHQLHDAAAYQQWLRSEFGQILTQLREGGDQLDRADFILNEVDRISQTKGIPRVQAFHRFKLWEQGLDDPAEAYTETGGASSQAPEDDSFAESFSDAEFMRQFAEAAATMYEEVTGEKPPNYEQVMSGLKPPAPDNASASQIKICYRAIVRRLHPDRAGAFTPHEESLWHEAQAAYARHDLAALELILARCEAGPEDFKNLTRPSSLQQLVRQAQANLKRLQAQLRNARWDPAWRFTQRKDHDLLRRQIAAEFNDAWKELKEDLSQAQRTLARLENQYVQWLAKHSRQAPSRAPEIDPHQKQFTF
jgi:hypothetical protein